jgi:hypothetical protein
MSVSGRHFASWLWRGYQTEGLVHYDNRRQFSNGSSLVGTTRTGVSDTDRAVLYGSLILASALTHERQVAEDRNESDMMLPAANEDRPVSDSRDLGLAVYS